MKQLKKWISLLLCLALLLTLLPKVALTARAETRSGICGDNLTWTFDSGTGKLTITGTGDMYDFAWDNPQPWGDWLDEIKYVTIGNGVTNIGGWAFQYCRRLSSVTIPNSVTNIRVCAFNFCDSLTSVAIPASVSYIGGFAFEFCNSLTAVTVPAGVSFIGDGAFACCEKLQKITVSSDNSYFCSDSSGVLFDKSKKSLLQCPGAYTGSYTIPGSVTSIANSAFDYCTGLTGVTIPNGVTSIGSDAFEDCRSLAAVTIPDSVTSISDGAFFNCRSLTAVTIPAKVSSIGYAVFAQCDNLKTITVASGNQAYASDSAGVLYNKAKTQLIQCPCAYAGSYTIPSTVTSIDGHAFTFCSGLTAVTIPNSVTSLPDRAFRNCGSLSSVTLPNTITSIPEAAFFECTSLPAITIPDSVESIGEYAFYNCTSLPAITIPNSVKSIYEGAFFGCSSLTSVTIPNGVNYIDVYTFYGCSSLKSVTIPDSVVGFGLGAFENCSSLTSVTLPNSVKSIGEYTFCHCTGLASVTIPDSVETISEGAFYGCSRLSSVTIPDSVTSIDWGAFCECSRLKSIDIPQTVTEIGTFAFGYIWDDASEDYVKIPEFTIYGNTGSAAQSYANENGFKFISLDDAVGGFTDVKPGAYYANAVLWAVQNGITGGVDVHSFGPKKNCTREQIVTFLWKAKGAPEPVNTESAFTDVKPGKYYFKAVMWAVENKITGGAGDGKFGVGKPCTREQAMSFLWKACGSPEPTTTENPFTDVKPGKYYYKAVLWAVENGITGGTSADKFGVGKTCTRAQIVTFLYKALAEG